MTIPGLSEGLIAGRASAESFRRGEDYHRRAAVLSLEWGDGTLEAQVKGSDFEPYRVSIAFDPSGITHAQCSCPYTWGGWCKHIVATLLTGLSQPKKVQSRRRNLDPQQRAEFESTQNQVSIILHSLDGMRRSQAYWHVEQVVNQVRQMLHEVEVLLADEEWEQALLLLEAITAGYIADWTCLDDSDGFASAFFADLGRLWSEALATADLTLAQRRAWKGKLKRWQTKISAYGVEGVFEPESS